MRKAQNQGYGPEAVMLLANHLCDSYGLKSVSVRIAEENMQSRRAFEKVGAVLDNMIPDDRFEKTGERHR